jgi:mannose-6-phosphate isomerase-like protein (cupin superfamily)
MPQKNEPQEVTLPNTNWSEGYPFAPDKKRPCLLTQETSIPRVYGHQSHQVATRLHICTDKIACTEFTIQPGQYFHPPDIHTGDEVYYILKGTACVMNCESGQVHTVYADEVYYIPKGTWHQTFNFGDEPLVVLCSFAPEIWSGGDGGASRLFQGKPAFYKSGE